MSDVQKYFVDFHDSIKIVMGDNKELKEKRDEIIELIKSNLRSETSNSFETFSQGSYAMKTGIKALDDGDYDIDVGIIFTLNKDEEKPVILKEIVSKVLLEEYDDVQIKVPCVTVKFENEVKENRNYHVDFAVYIKDENEDMFIAKGKPGSNDENKYWEDSDPKELLNKIQNSYSKDCERKQFRRVIRYLKRWKDLRFKNQVNRPTGIGLTIAALDKFEVKYTLDPVSFKRKYNDLEALRNFVSNMINGFYYVFENDEEGYRLSVKLPTKPFNDVYKNISLKQMNDFKSKLENLNEVLSEAAKCTDPKEACELLAKEFGEDFPIPDEKDTAQSKNKAILTNTSSAHELND
ncbi:nucleotidyltransferase [Psychrobacillus sp. FSL W7-1457]|uniref:nucleotidyltransferase domain-containing protein n=1 Tax=Psychrobacillus sp. FSL W7-1457 TaxID=2954547 RepID=UPI00315B02E2